jgi:D-alanyl-D-alanine carboxypeptidase
VPLGVGPPPVAWFLGAMGVMALGVVLVRLAGSPETGIAATPDPSTGRPSAIASTVVVQPPPCSNGNLLAPFSDYAQWDETLLDTSLGVLSTYAPPDLVPVSRAGFEAAPGLRVRDLLIGDLAALRRAAALAGHPIAVEAAYRSYAQQASLVHRRRSELGKAEALSRTARPGHSEHQLGTTVDFKSFGADDVTQDWGSTQVGRWMQENAWRYGFILSYPKEKVALTCYAYEPWHFRYFGRQTAAGLHASGLTSREYLWNEQQHGS